MPQLVTALRGTFGNPNQRENSQYPIINLPKSWSLISGLQSGQDGPVQTKTSQEPQPKELPYPNSWPKSGDVKCNTPNLKGRGIPRGTKHPLRGGTLLLPWYFSQDKHLQVGFHSGNLCGKWWPDETSSGEAVGTHWALAWARQGWGSPPGPGTGCGHSSSSTWGWAHTCTGWSVCPLGGSLRVPLHCRRRRKDTELAAGLHCVFPLPLHF